MRVAIDTNRLTDYLRGEPGTVDVVQRCRYVGVPFVVLGESRAGYLIGARFAENEKLLSGFLSSGRTSILLADEDTTHHYARLHAQLRRQGEPIPTNDLWIAALCLQNNLPLFTRDKHFLQIPQLQCL